MFGKKKVQPAITFTLDYWEDEGWYVGKLREVPSVFSQGKSLDELLENIQDAYLLMIEDSRESIPVRNYQSTSISLAS